MGKYSVVDLFAGAGGLSLGFMQTNKYDIKVAFENNPDMRLNTPALLSTKSWKTLFCIKTLLLRIIYAAYVIHFSNLYVNCQHI